MEKPIFRVRDKRTGKFTRNRAWNRISDVRQHLNQPRQASRIEHLQVIQFAVSEQMAQEADDFCARRDWQDNPVVRPRKAGEL